MFKGYRRRRRLARVEPGDGSALARYRIWQLFTRSLFFIELPDSSGGRQRFEVDVRYLADSSTKKSPASLFRDSTQVSRANLPATFPVPGGVIEVATSSYGLKRMHYVTQDGLAHALHPDPLSQEGLRARFGRRFPRISRVAAGAAIAILLVGLVLSVPQGLELLTQVEVVAEQVGTFVSPVRLPRWANVSLLGAGILAGIERALTLRNHWLIDLETTADI